MSRSTKIFFVVSTGRSGTTTMAHVLSALPGVQCVHEQEPFLVREAWEYLAGRIHNDYLVERLQATRGPSANGKIWGESNQKLSFMTRPLAQAFPQAKFIWLVRNGADVVASFEHRRTYRRTRGEWNVYRPSGDVAGDVPPDEWRRMSPFAKCCWYWAFTNRRIKEDLGEAGRPWMLVRLETLATQLTALGRFLGTCVPASFDVPTANPNRGTVTQWRYWDRIQRREFRHHCGQMMDELYPGWSLDVSKSEVLRNEVLAQMSYRRPFGKSLRIVTPLVPKPLAGSVRRLLAGHGVLNFNDVSRIAKHGR